MAQGASDRAGGVSMLGVAIIGCGDMGSKHAAAWGAREDARLVAVCDHTPERAQTLAQSYGATRVDSWQEALAHSGVDVVSICVPACDHPAIAIAAAEAGKHVLCEKAMALTLAEADAMIAAAEANGTALSVCHQYRGLLRYRAIKEAVDAGRLGGPLSLRFAEMREVRPKLAMHRLSENGGPVHDMTGHLFDLARWLTGAEAESVTAIGHILGRGKPRLSPVHDFGIDTAEILVRFSGGHSLSIALNWGLPEGTPGHSQELIHGPMGYAYSSDPGNPDRFLGDLSDTAGVTTKDAQGSNWIACPGGDPGPEICVTALIEEIRTGTRSPFHAREGRAALRLIRAALQAIETGGTVMLQDPDSSG
ncbi:Gfo/Idh/MocA family oxidoreductase [Primorskyibacter aestuariivivens]|uniref:Gfo/Idh/MocA family protein n=1 Tax=Primorskyibacter aestuariivivens TaxID=1888912 RepID=UPI0023001B5B|nr:Gfo/Idh/MocA family oxidoreductase [Primorskyibacter aestuariivivens]MDA7427857.1 Gfo/Idh/MocA family oxidoreductase [Primorskyibacter aestuariivivens]